MSNEWIKISERKPGEKDFPVLFFHAGKPDNGIRLYYGESQENWTHWRLFREVPPREPAQDEKDARLITEIIHGYMSDSTAEGMPDLCRIAISHERSEIRQLLKRHQCGELPAPEVIREISRRVKLT